MGAVSIFQFWSKVVDQFTQDLREGFLHFFRTIRFGAQRRKAIGLFEMGAPEEQAKRPIPNVSPLHSAFSRTIHDPRHGRRSARDGVPSCHDVNDRIGVPGAWVS